VRPVEVAVALELDVHPCQVWVAWTVHATRQLVCTIGVVAVVALFMRTPKVAVCPRSSRATGHKRVEAASVHRGAETTDVPLDSGVGDDEARSGPAFKTVSV
jgi:hypothetical protein